MSRYVLIPALLLIPLGFTVTVSGCSSKPRTPGLLEQKGIKNSEDLAFVLIHVPEGNGSHLITDKATINRVYQLMNDAEHVSMMSKYFRPNMVVLVRKNGHTMSFAFGLYNPSLTWDYESKDFVEFVKKELVGSSKYLNKERLPAFSINQAVKIGNSGKQTILPQGKVGNIQPIVDVVTAAYTPYSSLVETRTWDEIAGFCTNENPGIEMVLKKPIRFQTLIGPIKPEPPHGSTELKLAALTVDRLVIYQGERRDLWIAFHSTAGNPGWFVTDGFEDHELQGRTAESIYRELISKAQ